MNTPRVSEATIPEILRQVIDPELGDRWAAEWFNSENRQKYDAVG